MYAVWVKIICLPREKYRFKENDATKVYGERLKAAAKLWGIVRDSGMEKSYSGELLEKYRDRL